MLVNPPMDRVISAGDQVIVIAEDDDTIVLHLIPPGLVADSGDVTSRRGRRNGRRSGR